MKIKEIVNEGFAKSFVKSLFPKGVQAAIDARKPQASIDDHKAAEQAYKLYGPADTEHLTAAEFEKAFAKLPPSEKRAAGIASWFTDWQKKQAQAQLKAVDDETRDQEEADKVKQAALEPGIPQVLGTQKTAAPSATMAAKMRPAITAPPPQVRLPSGEYITKYGNSWYNEQGQRVADPGSIASLERRTRKPSGQSQMATTKNIPVNLPGYRGKKR